MPNNMLGQTWVVILGSIFGALTLLFLMGLVFGSVFGFTVPCGARFLVISVLSFGAALSAAFLGGYASATGSLPIPGLSNSPLAITLGGGVAVLIIMFVLTSTLYTPGSCAA